MRSLFRLRTFVRPYWKQVVLALVALTLLTALKLIVPLIIRQVIDQGLTDGDVRLIVTAALSLLVIGLASAAFIYWQRYQTEIIAQRLSTIVNADTILVIHDGRIIEQGAHADLLALRGTYFHLYSSGFEE